MADPRRDSVQDRAEDLMLEAESLQRQMQHQGASTDALLQVGEVVHATADLFAEVSRG